MWDQPNDQAKGELDGTGFTPFVGDYGELGEPARAFAIEGEGQDGAVEIDNFIIRRYLDVPPEVTLGPAERVP